MEQWIVSASIVNVHKHHASVVLPDFQTCALTVVMYGIDGPNFSCNDSNQFTNAIASILVQKETV